MSFSFTSYIFWDRAPCITLVTLAQVAGLLLGSLPDPEKKAIRSSETSGDFQRV
jgi:hypothetical protein